MLTMLWNLSAAIRGYLRVYMPTNRLLDWLRTPRGLVWAVPSALLAVPGYLAAVAISAQMASKPGLGWLNVLVLLFVWNALKFGWMGLLAPVYGLRRAIARRAPTLP